MPVLPKGNERNPQFISISCVSPPLDPGKIPRYFSMLILHIACHPRKLLLLQYLNM